MNKKGFTLIELLAVIVLLTIIISILAKSVNTTISSSTSSISKTQKKALENAAQVYHIEENISLSCVSIDNLYKKGYIEKEDIMDPKTKENLKGSIMVENRNGNYKYIYQEKECEVLKNGTPVNFDVSKGEICTEDMYKASYDETANDYLNSNIGYNGITKTDEKQNSCLKFYVFNNDNHDTINMILDHDIRNIDWRAENYNKNGPWDYFLNIFQSDTKDWKGTMTPEPYTINHKDSPSKAYYTIDYNGFNARLITAEDLAKIGNTTWNGDSLTIDTDNNLWLFDRVSSNCKEAGCENNSNNEYIKGYWTASAVNSDDMSVLVVEITSNTPPELKIASEYSSAYFGVRPVITISKSKF